MFPSQESQNVPQTQHNSYISPQRVAQQVQKWAEHLSSWWTELSLTAFEAIVFVNFFLFSFGLGPAGRSVSCRLGNGAKVEPPLFNLAAALGVCSRRSSADSVTLPQKHSPCLCLSFSITHIFWFHSLSSYLFLSASHQTFPLFLFRYLSPSVFSFLSSPDFEISHQSPCRSLTPPSQKTNRLFSPSLWSRCSFSSLFFFSL